MTVGEAFTIRFQELLKQKGDSLYKFAKENCIPRSTITNIERGSTKSPTLAVVFQVAAGFGMDILHFLDHPVFKSQELDFL